MSYFKELTRKERFGSAEFLNILAAFILTATANVVMAIPVDDIMLLQHDDFGSQESIIKGTESAVCQSGVSSGFACKNVELLSRVPLENMGGGRGADSWGWKDPQTGRYYALMARSTGTSFVDVTDPESPVFLGRLPSPSGDRPWRDVKVYSDHAFIVADGIIGHGMQVFDLSRLRGITSPRVFDTDALYLGVGSAHNIAINEQSGFAYIVGSSQCDGGLHMVDIRAPLSPVFAGCYSGDGHSHDVQCVTYAGHDPDHQGSEICFASNIDSLTVVDVSDKTAPVMLGKALYPQTAYSHQGWLDEEHGLFFMGDEFDERNFGMNTRTLILDVRDLDNPVFADAHLHSTSALDHHMYVKDGYLYQANYLAGLRILQIVVGENVELTEVAYFDTEPTSDSLAFSGAWNVYPFFDNGTILVSDINNGLFVLGASLEDNTIDDSPINGSLSGAWVADGLNDQGIMLFVSENSSGPVIFYTWFAFLGGDPSWITGAAPFEYGDDGVAIPSQRLSGLGFVIPNNSTAIRQNIGNLNIHVHGCNEIHVDYDFGSLRSQELVFTRLAGVQGRGCFD